MLIQVLPEAGTKMGLTVQGFHKKVPVWKEADREQGRAGSMVRPLCKAGPSKDVRKPGLILRMKVTWRRSSTQAPDL